MQRIACCYCNPKRLTNKYCQEATVYQSQHVKLVGYIARHITEAQIRLECHLCQVAGNTV